MGLAGRPGQGATMYDAELIYADGKLQSGIQNGDTYYQTDCYADGLLQSGIPTMTRGYVDQKGVLLWKVCSLHRQAI